MLDFGNVVVKATQTVLEMMNIELWLFFWKVTEMFVTVCRYVQLFVNALFFLLQFHLWAHSKSEDRGLWADALEGL